MRPLTIFLFPFRVIITIFLSPIFSIFYLLMVLCVAFPSLLVRKLVTIIAQHQDKDLCKPVTLMGCVPSRDFTDWYTEPAHVLTVAIKIKGEFNLHWGRQHVLKNLITRRNTTTGELDYPELQQYCTTRLGYLFFRKDRQFKIENHVKLYKSKSLLPNPETDMVDEDKLKEIWEEASTRPFLPKTSPWEVFLIPNYVPPKDEPLIVIDNKLSPPSYSLESSEKYFALLLRVHHGLSDGMSVYRFLLTLTDHGLDIWEKEIASRQPPKHFRLFLHLKATIFGPTSAVWAFFKGNDLKNPIHPTKTKKTGRPFISTTAINLEKVKKIRKAHQNISFQSILISAIAGGIRRYLQTNGFQIQYSPIRLGMPVPKPGHSTKLRNEFLIASVELPVHKKTPRERILFVEKSLNDMKSSANLPFLLTQSMMLIGGFPVKIIRYITSRSGVSVMYSEMKGPDMMLSIQNGEMRLNGLLYSCPLGTDDLGLSFSSFSYNGKIHLILAIDKAVAKTREKADEFLNCIEKEFDQLLYGDLTNL